MMFRKILAMCIVLLFWQGGAFASSHGGAPSFIDGVEEQVGIELPPVAHNALHMFENVMADVLAKADPRDPLVTYAKEQKGKTLLFGLFMLPKAFPNADHVQHESIHAYLAAVQALYKRQNALGMWAGDTRVVDLELTGGCIYSYGPVNTADDIRPNWFSWDTLDDIPQGIKMVALMLVLLLGVIITSYAVPAGRRRKIA